MGEKRRGEVRCCPVRPFRTADEQRETHIRFIVELPRVEFYAGVGLLQWTRNPADSPRLSLLCLSSPTSVYEDPLFAVQ